MTCPVTPCTSSVCSPFVALHTTRQYSTSWQTLLKSSSVLPLDVRILPFKLFRVTGTYETDTVLHKAPEKCLRGVRSGDRGGWHVNLPHPQRNNISSTACYGLLSRHSINVLAPVILKNNLRFLIYKANICRSKIHKIKSFVYSYMFRQNSAMLRESSLHQYWKLARVYYITVVIHTAS